MPELPEVETLCRQLNAKIAGREILSTKVYDAKLAGAGHLRGRIITCVFRQGKTLVFTLDDGQSVLIHLRMSGRLFWQTLNTRAPHTRWRMRFAEGKVDLVDPRRFATVKLVLSAPNEDAKDLLRHFDARLFLERQAKRTVSVKSLLMDPRAIAGIGNIYACEILHAAGLSPLRPAATLCLEEWKRIFRVARRILKRGIENRGTSISDWRDLYGVPGENQLLLKAYGRQGKTCSACGQVIRRVVQGGRSTYYCPGCQT